MRKRKRAGPSPALTYFTPVSARYEERTKYRLECFDKLPPLLRETIREAFSDIHDPTELWQFARMRHNRPEALAAQVKMKDDQLREEREAAAKNCVPVPPERRALRRNHLKPDTWEVKKIADRAMTPPEPRLIPIDTTPTEPADATEPEPLAAVSWGSSLVRWLRG